jgi:hypothetical protein
LGEDLISLVVSCIECYSSCKVFEGGKLGYHEWWVVGGIYSPNHQTRRLVKAAVAWRTGQSGAPPDTVRCVSHAQRELQAFSAAKGLFSAASGRQKNPAENKAIFSAARAWPPKISYFRRLAPWPPKITNNFGGHVVRRQKLKLPKIVLLFSAARGAAEN